MPAGSSTAASTGNYHFDTIRKHAAELELAELIAETVDAEPVDTGTGSVRVPTGYPADVSSAHAETTTLPMRAYADADATRTAETEISPGTSRSDAAVIRVASDQASADTDETATLPIPAFGEVDARKPSPITESTATADTPTLPVPTDAETDAVRPEGSSATEDTATLPVPLPRATATRIRAGESARLSRPGATPGPHRVAANQSWSRAESLAGVAAVVAVVSAMGVGVGAYWIKVRTQPGAAPTESSAPAAPVHAAPIVHAPSVETAPTVPPVPVVEPPEVKPEPVAAPKSRPGPPASPRVPTQAARQQNPPIREVAVAAPPAVPEPPARDPEPPPPTALPEPPPVAAAPNVAPLRPFFEARDVTESPQIVRRVAPLLADELRGLAANDVVVVRLLVSQAGAPSSISLLRRSRAGQMADDAVVAAVKQWTFSPARKKGEAVSCWMNVGVPIGQ
jgi:protein TonB